MLKEEFIKDIQDELSVSCSLPFKVPEKEIGRIIEYAAKWFYKKYEDAVEERYYVIEISQLQNEVFRKYKTIELPECIFSVNALIEVSKGFRMSLASSPDFSVEKMIFRNLDNISESIEGVMTYVVYENFYDLARHTFYHPVSFNFNRNTRKLVIKGEVPKNDLVLDTYVKVPLEFLMEDEIFFRYCVAKAKTQLSRILGTFNFSLPGGVEINYSDLASEGKEELDKIEEEIKSDEGMDWFLTTGGM